MKLVDVIKSANSNLWRNKGRSLLTILAILIGAFTIIMTTGINTGVNGYIDKQLQSAGGDGYLEIMPSGMLDTMTGSSGMMSNEVAEYNPNSSTAVLEAISQADLDKMADIPGIDFVKPYSPINTKYIAGDNTDKKYVLTASEMPTDTIRVDMAAGQMVDINSLEPQIALPDKYVAPLGFADNAAAVGAKVRVAVTNRITMDTVEREATISGIMNASIVSMGRSWINGAFNDQLQAEVTAGMPEEYASQVNMAFAQVKPDFYGDEQIQVIKDQFRDIGYSAMTVADGVGMIKTFFNAVTTVLTIFGVIALLAASIGIVNTLFMAVQERTREIGLMKALGLGKGKIRLMFSLEAVALGFWGSAVGVVLAYAARLAANSLSEQTFLKDLPGFTLVEFEPMTLLVIVAIVMAIAFLAGTLPARKASKLDPIEALRYE
jgi:putative ABC transport system permease protein